MPPEKKNQLRSSQLAKNKRQPKNEKTLKPPPIPKPDSGGKREPASVPEKPNPMDMNYDGYYDDVLTDDNGRTKEKLDRELIKRNALIAIGVVVIVALSIIIMSVL